MSLTALYLFGKQPNKPIVQPDINYDQVDDFDSTERLVEAMIQVESGGDDNAIGDTHLETASVGCLQIRPILVKDVNRILKRCKEETRYTLEDRYSREKSIMMFRIWKSYYHTGSSFEKIARCWNGGPCGHKKSATLSYWKKVEAYLY